VASAAAAREAEIWHELVRVRRRVARADYAALAAASAPAAPAPGRWRILAAHDPVRVAEPPRPRARRAGRRPSNAVSSAKAPT
jgi:hypothetical protein